MGENKNILYGGPDVPDVDPNARSFGEMALKQFEKNGSQIVFIDALSGIELTSMQLREDCIRVAQCLQAYDIGEGDAVGLCSENRIEFPSVVFGTFLVGATLAPLNVTYSERELHHAVNLSRPKVIFASPAAVKGVLNVAKQNGFIKKIIIFDDKTNPDKYIESFKLFLHNASVPWNDEFDCKPIDMKDNVALILCSSGTTGLPKGVQLTQYNISISTSHIYKGFNDIKDSFEGGAAILSIIPWFHAYGVLTSIGMSICGTKTVFLPKFEEKAFLNALEKYKVNLLFAVPPLMVFLAKHPLVDKYDLSNLLVIYCGAAPLSREIEDAVIERIGVMAVRQGFGMSEMTLSVLAQDPEHDSPGSVGYLRPGIWGKIIDPETGRTLGVNERGEMCFKGSSVMKGYVGDDEATRNTIDKDGWLHTGDVGYYTEKEEWFIVDRIKELIKFKGFQVPPAEIETILLTHPHIADAAVIGIPDDAAGELPMGFVVKQSGVSLTEKEVLDYVASKTSYAKRLHGGVHFITEIPKNPSGKILRRELRDLMKNKKSKL